MSIKKSVAAEAMKEQKNTINMEVANIKKQSNENEDTGPGWDILKFNKLYQESIIKVKDPRTFYVHGKYVKSCKSSLGLLDNKTKFRWGMMWLVTSKRFEQFIISLIMINSVFLGIKDYTDVENKTSINRFVE